MSDKNDKENVYEQWSRMVPPARPSPDVVRYFEERIAPGSRVLLLGCTPEFRDVCRRKRCGLVVLDIDQEIYDNTSRMVREKGAETFVRKSWLEFSDSRGFQFVIGHGSFNMIDFASAEKALRNLVPALTPDGRFIVQFHVQGRPSLGTVAEILAHWRAHPGDNIITHTWIDFLNLASDPATGEFSYAAWKRLLAREAQKGALSAAELRLLLEPHRGHGITMFLHDKDKLFRLLRSLFRGIETYSPADYRGAEFHPVLNLGPRLG